MSSTTTGTEPAMRTFCAAVSAEHEEPLFAKATATRAWLLLEHPGPWAEDALASALPELAEPLRRAADEHGVRIVLIRRHDRRPTSSWTCYLAWTGGDPVWVEQRRLRDHAETLGIDFAALGAGERSGSGAPVREPFFLVCTHGRKDACCARFGRPAVAALSVALDGRVWECTHIGGDRFAANLLCFPHGLYFGRVGPSDALRIANAYTRGEIDLAHYRGRPGVPVPVQAADWYLRAQTGVLRIDDVRPVSARRRDGAHEVELDAPDGRWRLAVRPVILDARPVGCGDDNEWQPRHWELVTSERVPAHAQ